MIRPLPLVDRCALMISVAVFLIGCGGSQASILPTNIARKGAGPATEYPFDVLYSFKGGENGQDPFGTLLVINGIFYGATLLGGNPKCYGKAYGCGTLFTVTAGGKQHVLYRFKPPGGVNPDGNLIHLGSSLYGVTSAGGPYRSGTVFEVSTFGKERTIYIFKGSGQSYSDGRQPQGGLRYLDGKFYGVTLGGGAYDEGTIFEVSLAGKERVLHAFKGGNSSDGAEPQAALTDVNGTLYGTTSAGGGRDIQGCAQAFGNSCGTVFSITPAGQYHVLYRFKGKRDAAYPIAGLTYLNGELYGTSFFGGVVGGGCPAECGTVFEVNPATGQEHVVYRFKGGADGYQPGANLLAYRGTLYGTTNLGGSGSGGCSFTDAGCGTIFKIASSGEKTILYNFAGEGRPNSGLVVEAGGNLYGTTAVGGPYCHPIMGCGTFFRLTI